MQLNIPAIGELKKLADKMSPRPARKATQTWPTLGSAIAAAIRIARIGLAVPGSVRLGREPGQKWTITYLRAGN